MAFWLCHCFWDAHVEEKKNILNIKYEDLVSNYSYYQEKIYKYLGINTKYDEKKRDEFFSPTASTRQVKEVVHQRSIDKREFSHHKSEFLDALFMQREYWAERDIKAKSNDFFGYSLK